MATTSTHAKVYIVRHGETDANRQGIMQGQMDTALNEVGIEQARLAAEVLKSVRFDRAFSSDLTRAVNTAKAILAHHPDVQLDRQVELRERHLGKLQGKSRLFNSKAEPDPSAESATELTRRAISWWNSAIVGYLASLPPREDGEAHQILVVSHGGFIGTLVHTLIARRTVKCKEGVVVAGKCLNASVSVIEFDEKAEGILVKFGDIGHLSGDSVVQTNVDEL